MSIQILTFPDQQTELADWLERQLTSPDLGQCVSELKSVAKQMDPPGFKTPELSEVLAEYRQSVLHNGLKSLSQQQLLALITSPDLLLDLQEEIMIACSPYWIDLFEQQSIDAATPEICDEETNITASSPTEFRRQSRDDVQILQPVKEQKQSRRVWGGLLAAAALVLIAVPLMQFFPGNSSHMIASNWGWDAPGALDQSLAADQYLKHLADGAKAWFNQRPETEEALQTRIAEFRHGCQTLIEADHPALSPAEQEWLLSKCKAWAGKLDQHLVDLNASNVPIVREQADQTIQNLIDALQMKASEIG